MKIGDNESLELGMEIREVKLTNVSVTPEAAERVLGYNLSLSTDPAVDDTATVAISLFTESLCESVEMETCLLLDAIPRVAIDLDIFLTLLSHPAYAVPRDLIIDYVLTIAAARAAKLEVVGLSEEEEVPSIRFTLTIGPHFRTEATVEAEKLKQFFVIG